MKLITTIRHAIGYRPNLLALFFFLVAFGITQYIAYGIYTVERKSEYLQVRQEAIHIRNRLESALNHSVTATKTLAFLVEKDLLGEYFDDVSMELLSDNTYIDALQLVRGNTIVMTYPVEGNEETIGYTVMDNSMHRSEAMKAYDRKKLYFEGPIRLQQGGTGMVGRHPIFRADTLWGFSAVVIRRETFLNAIGINQSGSSSSFYYQITKYPEQQLTGNRLFHTSEDFSAGIVYRAFVPIGDWHIDVKMRYPRYWFRALRFAFLGLLTSVLLAVFIRVVANQPYRLRLLVAEKTADLDKVNRMLEEHASELTLSNKELEQFAYVASHDLQEPLRMVTGFLTRLEKKYNDQLDEKGKLYVHYAVDGANRMRQVILDLLQYSRMTSMHGEKEPVGLNELINDYRILRQQLIEEKKATIISDSLPMIHSYKAPLIQVFHNLLDNALKYAREGVDPDIRISVADRKDHWEFSVSDNGIGIEPEYFEKIFIIFQRLHPSEEYSGTGIGLAIVSKVVKSLGGQITVESQPGKGSTFRFTLPK